MKADPDHQRQLLDVGDIDVSLERIRATRRQLPEQAHLDEVTAALGVARQENRDALAARDDLDAELARAESDVELVEKRIAQDTQRLDHSSSVKDVQGLQHEIDTLKQRLDVLEDVELEVMERRDTAVKHLDEIEARVSQLDADHAAAQDALKGALDALTQDEETLLARRAALVASLPQELVDLYDRQNQRYGRGVSLLRAGVSGASGVKLTESDLADIRKAAPDDVILCPDSNAILVRTSESGI